MTGVVNTNVARVTITRRDSSVIDAPLAEGPIGDMRFFATFSDTPEQFPTLVRAYSSTGVLVGQYRSQARALCPTAKPDCLE
jgi:hypothetical protein